MNKQKFSSKKRKFARWLVPALIIIAGTYITFMIPSMVQTAMPKVSTVFPQKKSYTPSVSCSGMLEYSDLYSITEQMPLVIKEFKINEGGRVDEGQLIASVDKEKTLSALTALYGTAGLDNGSISQAVNSLPTEIISPVSGAVFSLAKSGELINAGDSIAQIGDKGKLVLKAAVSERNISQVCIGQSVTVTAAASETEFSGTVNEISSCARKQYNGSAEETVVDITVVLSNPTDELKSGFSAQGVIKTGLTRELTTLPYSAICQDEKGEYIYIFDRGSASRKDITTGLELSDGAQVIGVDDTDEVILQPQSVAANSPVIRIVKEESDKG